MNLFVQPLYSLILPFIVDAVSKARSTDVPTAHALCLSTIFWLNVFAKSSVTDICSDSSLCFCKSSTSIERNMLSEQCSVIYPVSMPFIFHTLHQFLAES